MKIAILGKGRMGKMVEQLALQMGHFLTDVSYADVFIDFSHPSVVLDHIKLAIESKKPIVIGTTGWDEEMGKAQELIAQSSSAAPFSANFSLGMHLFMRLLKEARTFFAEYEVAGVEFHHSGKQDAPSGTAKSIAQALDMERRFVSVRCGRMPGKHEIIFDSADDMITLTHEAHNREGFARGAIKAAVWILDKKGWFTLDDMLGNLYSAHHSV